MKRTYGGRRRLRTGGIHFSVPRALGAKSGGQEWERRDWDGLNRRGVVGGGRKKYGEEGGGNRNRNVGWGVGVTNVSTSYFSTREEVRGSGPNYIHIKTEGC